MLSQPQSLSSKTLGGGPETGVHFWNSKHVYFLSGLALPGSQELCRAVGSRLLSVLPHGSGGGVFPKCCQMKSAKACQTFLVLPLGRRGCKKRWVALLPGLSQPTWDGSRDFALEHMVLKKRPQKMTSVSLGTKIPWGILLKEVCLRAACWLNGWSTVLITLKSAV